jgi:hypothetical protein
MKRAFVVLAAVLLLPMTLGLIGCGSKDTTTIITDVPSSTEETATLTPLERGQLRREALRDIELAVDAWVAGDRERMAEHYAEEMLTRFTDQWDELAARAQTMKHVHRVDSLDVIDMNSSGTQVLATYKFFDESVAVDESGRAVEEPVNADADVQFTVERNDDGSWTIVRIIGPVRSVR